MPLLATSGARPRGEAAADEGWPESRRRRLAGPDSGLSARATHPPARTPEAITLMRETIEIAFLTVIQLLTPQQRAALILCDVLDWSARTPRTCSRSVFLL